MSAATKILSQKSRNGKNEHIFVATVVSIVIALFHYNFDISKPKSYLLYATLVACFRCFMYSFYRENITLVKIDSCFWSNEPIMEVMDAYVSTIRHIMFLKMVFFGWASICLNKHVEYQLQMSWISFALDLWLIFKMVTKNSTSSDKSQQQKALIHENIKVPFVIQLSVVLAGAYCSYKNY